MIPRLKPYLGWEEFTALWKHAENAVRNFESGFARKFGLHQAIAFPYGRSALWAFFKALGIEQAEIVQPAYTCSVVAHATVLSGNVPRFVDCTLSDYNMDLHHFASVINQHTRAVIPTHLFGYPMNVDSVQEIVRNSEKRFGHKIWVIQDCAHSFGAKWKDKSVVAGGDGALFGLNISKTITSIFGGMLTFQDKAIAGQVRAWRDEHFIQPSWVKTWLRRLYLLAIYPAFNESLYGLVYWLQERTPLLNRLTRAYHLDEKIHFPPDYLHKMIAVEAQVGLVQLGKYDEIIRKRREAANYYFTHLQPPEGWIMPPRVEGATYSHFVIRVPDRQAVLQAAAARGVQLGQLIEYSVPHLKSYRNYVGDGDFPNAGLYSSSLINLPVYPGLDEKTLTKVANLLNILR